ncbi:Pleiotropic drug resistance protein 3 [Vitis vinifera]|uniref:Pleiotropic drug resistance protein 3 n=1 Tax=Vitis vinifera TaxID=29760 RepID=A0A438IY40_VITVI|nr:Pleiotropic drug resistance protein 3 [Vitis vinifera]
MAQFLGRDEKESLGMELAELGRSIGSPFHHHTSSFRSRTSDAKSYKEKDDEVDLQWAAIERLPTFERVRTSLFGHHGLNDGKEELGKRVIHVTKLGALECNVFIDKLLKKIEENNHQLLQKLREGMDRQAAPLFLLEVRYQNLSIEAECEVVHGEPLPTLWNTLKSTFHVGYQNFTRCKSQANMIKILKDVSGIIKAFKDDSIAGTSRLWENHFVTGTGRKAKTASQGEITYKGCNLDKFVPQKTSAYISQYDLHIPEMSVRETLDFSALFNGEHYHIWAVKMRFYLRSQGLWNVVMSEADPPPLGANPTVAQMKA